VLKSFNLIPLIFILTLSILTPSAVLTLDHHSYVVIGEFNDDEGESNSENDIEDIDVEEGEDEKKEQFFTSLIGLYDSLIVNNTIASMLLVEGISTYTIDIQLPPPEYSLYLN